MVEISIVTGLVLLSLGSIMLNFYLAVRLVKYYSVLYYAAKSQTTATLFLDDTEGPIQQERQILPFAVRRKRAICTQLRKAS